MAGLTIWGLLAEEFVVDAEVVDDEVADGDDYEDEEEGLLGME